MSQLVGLFLRSQQRSFPYCEWMAVWDWQGLGRWAVVPVLPAADPRAYADGTPHAYVLPLVPEPGAEGNRGPHWPGGLKLPEGP